MYLLHTCMSMHTCKRAHTHTHTHTHTRGGGGGGDEGKVKLNYNLLKQHSYKFWCPKIIFRINVISYLALVYIKSIIM